MEHNVYICGWAESSDGFEVWIKSRPQVRARGTTCEEAMDALLVAIEKAGGAFQAVMEFVPPLPQSNLERKYANPELYLISGDDRFDTEEPRRIPFETEEECARRISWYDDFFTAPVCRACLQSSGFRNERRIRVTHLRSGFDGGFLYFAGAFLRVFSEDFLMLLSAKERESLQFQLVDRTRKARKQFFELIGPSGPAEIAVASRQVNGWQCPSCQTRVFGYEYSAEISIRTYIAQSDLPSPLPDVFTVGTQPQVSLCVTAKRWATMVGKRGTRGCISQLLGVVPDAEVIRRPHLDPPQESR